MAGRQDPAGLSTWAARQLAAKLRDLPADESGSAAILVGISTAVLAAIAAFVIDLSNAYVVEGRLQNAADAGAVAAVVELIVSGDSARAKLTAVDVARKMAGLAKTRLSTQARYSSAITIRFRSGSLRIRHR